jgi:hypothetical protein
MSPTLGLGLVLQLSSLLLLLAAFGKATFRRVAPYLVICAITYHGITELVQLLTGVPSAHRQITSTQSIDQWTVLLGATLLIFSIFYVVLSRGNPRSSNDKEKDHAAAVQRILRVFDWRVLAIACLPLLAFAGHSEVQASSISDPSGMVGLARQFLALCLSLTLISFIAPNPSRRLIAIVPALGLVTVIGTRLGVIVFAGTVFFGLAMIHRSPPKRRILAVGLISLVLALSIGAARGHVGRQQFMNAPLAERAQMIVVSTISVMNGETSTFADQQESLGQRLDGNSFPAAIMDNLKNRGPVGIETVKNDIALAVPSALNPSKLSTDVTSRSEKEYIRQWYGMTFRGDFLPTQFGTMLAYAGWGGLLGIGAFLGAVFAAIDQRLLRLLTPGTFLLALSLLGCVLDYEGSMDAYTVGLRGALMVFLFISLLDRHRQEPAGSGRRRWWRRRRGSPELPTGELDHAVSGWPLML